MILEQVEVVAEAEVEELLKLRAALIVSVETWEGEVAPLEVEELLKLRAT